ncbi:MAG: hypothetical protein HO274_02300 [Ferrovum myxofaciens]|uniref:Nmad3 family putative nucleotide modification protein n=1 Tax=Ferrovum myxofaciens TaxID=416213 RepID=UPI002351FD92|nr:hypothetical protein [Ferrovum myxofaciens]QKE40291.1 MAG: hypothetical protein HO274_02300 [Ferrovum myxofaciens]
MRLIFSRKGFDSQYGGVPSPILPDGRVVSLPIPSSGDLQRLGVLRAEGIDLGVLTADLTHNRIDAQTAVHVDPDLHGPALARASAWRPAFGQIAAAQGHLQKQGVGPGDLFLFFGWFRKVERIDGVWRYVPGSPDMHTLFGWLQVGEVLPVTGRVDEVLNCHSWLREHPHIAAADRFSSTNNTIYVAAESLCLGGTNTGHPGGGIFERFIPSLRLTADGRKRSCWRLPAWFMPVDGRHALSYHGNRSRWVADSDSVLLQTVAKGQEFVLDCDYYPEATEWMVTLLTESILTSSIKKS